MTDIEAVSNSPKIDVTINQETYDVTVGGANNYNVTVTTENPINVIVQEEQPINVTIGGGLAVSPTNFLNLSDTPSTYSGKGNYLTRVNSGQTALEFVNGADIYVPYTGATSDINIGDHNFSIQTPGGSGVILTNEGQFYVIDNEIANKFVGFQDGVMQFGDYNNGYGLGGAQIVFDTDGFSVVNLDSDLNLMTDADLNISSTNVNVSLGGGNLIVTDWVGGGAYIYGSGFLTTNPDEPSISGSYLLNSSLGYYDYNQAPGNRYRDILEFWPDTNTIDVDGGFNWVFRNDVSVALADLNVTGGDITITDVFGGGKLTSKNVVTTQRTDTKYIGISDNPENTAGLEYFFIEPRGMWFSFISGFGAQYAKKIFTVEEDDSLSTDPGIWRIGNAIGGSEAHMVISGQLSINNGPTEYDQLGGYTFPFFDGTSGQVLKTDGAGNLTWQTIADPDLSGYVPYTGATTNVDLNNKSISNATFNTSDPTGLKGIYSFYQDGLFYTHPTSPLAEIIMRVDPDTSALKIIPTIAGVTDITSVDIGVQVDMNNKNITNANFLSAVALKSQYGFFLNDEDLYGQSGSEGFYIDYGGIGVYHNGGLSNKFLSVSTGSEYIPELDTLNIGGGDVADVRLTYYTTDGFLKTSGSDGRIVVDTNTYLTDALSDGSIYGRQNGSWVSVAAIDTDELVKYNVSDSSAGYLADKIVAGTGITLAEGTGGDADKLVITNTLDTSPFIPYTGSTFTSERILGTNTSGDVVALDSGTYPTIAELAFVKGVTDNIQDQIDDITPAGTNGQIQYNDLGSFGGATKLNWNKITERFMVGSTSSADQTLEVAGKLKFGDDGNSPSSGTVKFDGTNFKGYNGSDWISLDVQAASGGGWTESTSSDQIYLTNNDDQVGIGTTDPQQKLDVDGTTIVRDKLKVGTNEEGSPDYTPTQMLEVVGKIKIGNDSETPSVGTMRYESGSFQGYTATGWVPLDVQSFSGGGWSEDTGWIYTSNIGNNVSIGSVSDEGYKLYVDGTTRFKGNSFISGGKVYITSTGTSIPAGAQRLQVDGKIGVGNDSTTPTEGTIRYYLGAFEGYTATGWKPLDATPSASAGGWTDDGTYVTLTSPSRLVGIGTATPTEELEVNGSIRSDKIGIGKAPTFLLDVDGAIRIGASPSIVPQAGEIRWNGSDFEGYNGSYWINFAGGTGGDGGSGGWTESEEDNKIYPTNFATRNVAIGHYEPTEKLHVVGNSLTSAKVGIGSVGSRRLNIAAGTYSGMTLAPATLPVTNLTAGDMFIDSGDSNTLKWYNGSEWVSAAPTQEFTALSDTPSSYASQGTRVLAVKADETGIEFISGGTVGTDEKTKVSADDTTEGYLEDKLVAGEKITLTTNNTGSNETITIAVDLGDLNATYAKLDGSNHPFDLINVDNQLYIDSHDTDNSSIVRNAYQSGGDWYAKDPTKPAVQAKFLADTSSNAVFTILTAETGSSPLSWTQQFFVNEQGDMQVAGNILSANLSGTNSGDQDLSSYAQGTVVTSVGTPGSDSNIPTEQAVREALSSAGYGDVTGPTASTDGNIVLFDGETGKIIKDSTANLSSYALNSSLSDYATLSGSTFTGNIYAPNLTGTNTGDQTITLTGNVTGSGTGSFATTIVNNAINTARITDGAVTFDKLLPATTQGVIVGRYDTGSGNFQEIVLGSNLSLSGDTLNAEGGAGTAVWGGISGVLSDQTDLNTRLEAVKKDAITFNFSGLSTGLKQYGILPYPAEVVGWRLVAAQSGSVVVDVWKDSGAKPTSSAQSICGSEKPTLSGSDIASDTNLTTWTTSLSTGDVLAFNIDSISGVDQITLVLEIEK